MLRLECFFLATMTLVACNAARHAPPPSTISRDEAQAPTSPALAPSAEAAGPPWQSFFDCAIPQTAPSLAPARALRARVVGTQPLSPNRKDGICDWEVSGGLEGSFTAAGRSEIAYLIEPFSSLPAAELAARCGASAASAPHHFVLAEVAHRKYATGEAVEGERLLLDVIVPEDRIAAAQDLDGDGVDEVLLLGHARARVVRASGSNLQTVQDFGDVGECPAAPGRPAAVFEQRKINGAMQLRVRPTVSSSSTR